MDSHTLFAEVDQNNLPALLKADQVPTDPDQKAVYDKLLADDVNQYKHDGKAPDKDDPKESIWVKVEFLKPWKAEEPAAPAAGKDNAAGGAPAPAGAATQNPQFQAGVTMYLPEEVAGKLEKDGIVKLDNSDPATSRIYQRPLRDYARLFRNAYVSRNRLFTSIADLQTQLAQVQDAHAKLKEDIDEATKIQTGLKADLTKFKSEIAIVDSFIEALTAKFDATRGELSQLFRSNLKMAEQLTTAQRQLIDAIRRRSPPPEASAAAAPR
jgi:hypothetical protein